MNRRTLMSISRRRFLKQAGFAAAALPAFSLSGLAGCAQRGTGSRPNILLILADDLGYSDLGCYGGEIETPNLDELAGNGLRFTQMYNSARCCPTRASLLTGLYPHQTGIGNFVRNRPDAPHGYRGFLQPNTVTVAEVLKEAGYRTFMTGKWHVNDPVPTEQGFEEFYGFVKGYATNSWDPTQMIRLPEGRPQPKYEKGEFFSQDAVTDHAIDFIQQAREETPDQPWFAYVAYRGPHFPVQAPKKYVEKYKETYTKGWDKLRESRLTRMKEIGLLEEDVRLSPRSSIPIPRVAREHGVPGDLEHNPAWDEIPADRQADLARRMAVYAGMVDNLDHNVGRMVEDLKANGEIENTLILFLSDNGSCAEWGPYGFDLNENLMTSSQPGVGVRGGTPGLPSEVHTGEALEQMGGPEGDGFAYGSGWANVSNTPLSEYKQYTHEGGIATPMIAHWPSVIKEEGAFRRQTGHVFDVTATCIDVARATYPYYYDGHDITPLEGISLLPVFRGETLPHRSFVFAHFGNVALLDWPWKLVAEDALADQGLKEETEWELYNLEEDRPEINNLVSKHPDRVEVMKKRYTDEAWRIGIFPQAT